MKRVLLLLSFFMAFVGASAQTSWKGTTNSWSTASNWTNGIPTSSKAAIIGDANFTGSSQPVISGSAACASLTIGGAKASTLTLSKNLTVSGAVTINSGSALTIGKATMTIGGSLTNNGTISTTANQSANIFSGSATISGTGSTQFRKLTINANCVVTANSTFTTTGALALNGTLAPASTITIGGGITVASTGTLRVTASTLAGNYSGTVSLSAGSTVEYNSSGAQTISNNYQYSTLRISGSGTRKLEGNFNSAKYLLSSSTAYGNLYVDAGILDLEAYTINRGTTTTGGTLSVSNGATLRLSASNFPANFNSNTLSFTSTVEYYGAAQTVSAKTYGNLSLSGSGTKTFPATATSIAGNFSSSGTATALAGANITISGSSNIGSGTTLNAVSYTIQTGNSIVNNGTISGGTGTFTLAGAGATLSGSGANNFNNLTIVASGNSSSVSAISVSGNLATTGSGVFTHSSGTLSMSGSAKTISGSNITLSDLSVSGSVTASNGFTLTGNLAVSGTLSTSGILIMSGSSKTISGAGTIDLNTLSATGSISTATSFSISNTLDVTGSLSASAGTVTFKSVSLFNGSASLFNVTLNGTSLQLAANSTLGIAGALTLTAGTFNATTTTPNTVVYNSSGAQNVTGTTYDNLTLSNGNTKTATGAISTNTDLNISANTTFAASTFSHTVKGSWNNSGTFTASSSTVSFTGANDATLTGATTFNILTISKTSSTNSVFLANNMTVPTLNMTNGVLRTQSNKITITGTRTGSGYIYGTIERSHAFSSGTDYAFESADNYINFTGASGITGITVTVTQGSVSTFPFGAAINRNYSISLAAGSYTSAKLRLHYDDAELNGNSESGLQEYRYGGSSWSTAGVSGSSSTSNYAEQSGLTNITGSWTLASTTNVVTWNGSVSSDWNTSANWTNTQGSPSMPPSSGDIVQLGSAAFTYQPTITTAANAKSILFGSAQAVTLTLGSGGSLTTQGNISGSWSTNTTHTLDVGAQTLTVNGGIVLSDGTTGHAINLVIGSGTVNLTGSLTETGGANITFSGAGNLAIGGDFSYTSGTFTASTGTVTYNGSSFQAVGGVTYNQLVVNKTAATATAGSSTTINGNLTVTAGTFDFSGPTTIIGNVTIASGAFATNRTTINIGGNWTNNGTYLPNGGSATFNGTGTQTLSATSFNKIIVNKASGTLQLTGNISLNSDLLITAGTMDLGSFTANRNTIGGTLQLADGATLYVGGSNNFPANYTYYTFGTSSTTNYNGSVAQSVGGISYGNLVLTNGSSNAKTLAAPATVAGNLSISSGATLNGSSHNLTLYGNLSNSGSFVPATGAVLAMGTTKTITGTTTFNKLTVYGSYTVAGSDITYNGALTIVSGGSFNAGSGNAVLYGNLTNSGSLTSNGSTTFAGTQVQTISLSNAITSTSTGVINFNGSVAPVLNSTSTPIFATLNINNTDPAGISPSVDWTIGVAFNIAAGATFNGGVSTHTIAGNFTNNGTVTSSGTMYFAPSYAATAALGNGTFSSSNKVNFGGSAALTVTGTPGALTDVIIGNSTGVTASSNWSSISGTFTINSNGIFNAGSYTHTLAGNMESNGTLNGGSSNFIFTSAVAQISGSATTTFYDMTVNTGAILTVNSEFNVSHDLTDNGSIDATLAGVSFTGSTTSNITGSAASLVLADFDIEKNTGVSVVLQKNISGITDLNITTGTLDMGALSLSQDGTTGAVNTFTIENYGRLRIGGSSSLPAFTQYALDSFSIVEYYGGTQALTPTVTYGTLEVTAGAKTTSAAFTALKHVTISGGTLTGGAFTHSVGGDWTQTGGSFDATGTTIAFNGVSAQTVTANDAFNNVTINNTNNVSLGSLVKVSGTLAFTSGKIVLGSYNLLPGSISGAGTNSYAVATGTGVLRMPLAAGATKAFPVGTGSSYIPATIAFTAGSTSDSISVRLRSSSYVDGEAGTVKNSNTVSATWIIDEKVAGGSDATITLQWPAALEQTGFVRSTARMAHYTGGAWDYGTVSISAAGSNPYTLTRPGFTSFSPFSVRMNSSTLPLTWLSFSGVRRNGSDALSWSTASESNTARFEVQESSDGNSYRTIGSVAAAGNSSSVQQYNYNNSGVQGTRYYRIRQVDLDGRFSYSTTVRLNDATSTTTISLGANPVRGNVSLQLQVPAATRVQLTLHDGGGRLVWSNNQQLASGTQSALLPTGNLAAGLYYLNASFDDGSSQTIKLVKE
jgi:fibronectin-binding autotransporter adhesin